jgi:hypothetical protein
MSSKLTLSLLAALALSVGATGVARADSKTNDEINAAEEGNQASVDYPNRTVPNKAPTDAEIDADESGVPASVDYGDRKISKHNPTNAEIDAAEEDNPASVDYPNRNGGK